MSMLLASGRGEHPRKSELWQTYEKIISSWRTSLCILSILVSHTVASFDMCILLYGQAGSQFELHMARQSLGTTNTEARIHCNRQVLFEFLLRTYASWVFLHSNLNFSKSDYIWVRDIWTDFWSAREPFKFSNSSQPDPCRCIPMNERYLNAYKQIST